MLLLPLNRYFIYLILFLFNCFAQQIWSFQSVCDNVGLSNLFVQTSFDNDIIENGKKRSIELIKS